MPEKVIVAVMQRPGKRGWIIYDASLLTDPDKRKRDPDLYLAERAAAGDTRIAELPAGAPIWLPGPKGWAPAGNPPGMIVVWKMDLQGHWSYALLRG